MSSEVDLGDPGRFSNSHFGEKENDSYEFGEDDIEFDKGSEDDGSTSSDEKDADLLLASALHGNQMLTFVIDDETMMEISNFDFDKSRRDTEDDTDVARAVQNVQETQRAISQSISNSVSSSAASQSAKAGPCTVADPNSQPPSGLPAAESVACIASPVAASADLARLEAAPAARSTMVVSVSLAPMQHAASDKDSQPVVARGIVQQAGPTAQAQVAAPQDSASSSSAADGTESTSISESTAQAHAKNVVLKVAGLELAESVPLVGDSGLGGLSLGSILGRDRSSSLGLGNLTSLLNPRERSGSMGLGLDARDRSCSILSAGSVFGLRSRGISIDLFPHEGSGEGPRPRGFSLEFSMLPTSMLDIRGGMEIDPAHDAYDHEEAAILDSSDIVVDGHTFVFVNEDEDEDDFFLHGSEADDEERLHDDEDEEEEEEEEEEEDEDEAKVKRPVAHFGGKRPRSMFVTKEEGKLFKSALLKCPPLNATLPSGKQLRVHVRFAAPKKILNQLSKVALAVASSKVEQQEPAPMLTSFAAYAPYNLSMVGKHGKSRMIGGYTLEQRRQRIMRFVEKRRNRVWMKKVKYGCRKKLADSRPRVKGRFVPRTGEEDGVDGDVGDDACSSVSSTLDEAIPKKPTLGSPPSSSSSKPSKPLLPIKSSYVPTSPVSPFYSSFSSSKPSSSLLGSSYSSGATTNTSRTSLLHSTPSTTGFPTSTAANKSSLLSSGTTLAKPTLSAQTLRNPAPLASGGQSASTARLPVHTGSFQSSLLQRQSLQDLSQSQAPAQTQQVQSVQQQQQSLSQPPPPQAPQPQQPVIQQQQRLQPQQQQPQVQKPPLPPVSSHKARPMVSPTVPSSTLSTPIKSQSQPTTAVKTTKTYATPASGGPRRLIKTTTTTTTLRPTSGGGPATKTTVVRKVISSNGTVVSTETIPGKPAAAPIPFHDLTEEEHDGEVVSSEPSTSVGGKITSIITRKPCSANCKACQRSKMPLKTGTKSQGSGAGPAGNNHSVVKPLHPTTPTLIRKPGNTPGTEVRSTVHSAGLGLVPEDSGAIAGAASGSPATTVRTVVTKGMNGSNMTTTTTKTTSVRRPISEVAPGLTPGVPTSKITVVVDPVTGKRTTVRTTTIVKRKPVNKPLEPDSPSKKPVTDSSKGPNTTSTPHSRAALGNADAPSINSSARVVVPVVAAQVAPALTEGEI